jgi:hypothetical protein
MIHMLKTDKNNGERSLKVGMIQKPAFGDANGFIFYFEKNKLIKIELWWFIC